MTRKEALEYINNMYMYEDTKNALETLIPEFGKTGSDKVIDHEDKYKEALLEARAVLEPCLKYSKGKVREALDSIDHELQSFESEDERIRKAALEGIEYLERKLGWDAIGDTDILDVKEYLEKQKEQKPVQDKEEKEYVRTLKSLIADFLYGKNEIDRGYYQKIYDWLDGRHIKQEPEWSDEDKAFLKVAIAICNRYSHKDIADWLKSLPERFNLQSKPEWSEMDELMMKAVIGILDERDHPKLCSFLKSLPLRCPKSSDNWKPSEEQMEALNKAIPVCMGVVGRDAVAPLESLCEQLERLM